VKALPLRQAAAGEAIIRVNPRDLNADTNVRLVERLLLLLAMWLGTTEYIPERRTFSVLNQDALNGFPGKITACKPISDDSDVPRQHYRTHKNHAQTRPEPPRSPRATPPLSSSHRNKRRRTAEGEQSEEVSVDPNDRLSAFATYISVYA
jgi:hypothetical protein